MNPWPRSRRPARWPPPELERLDAFWRAANYLSVGQIYLLDESAAARAAAARAHQAAAARPLGHDPGPELPLRAPEPRDRARRPRRDLHRRPGPRRPGRGREHLARGTYSEVYPNIAQDEEGMRQLFRQFSFPGGIPSHVAPETPGSIHEGGELGYSLAHAYGAVFDNPDLLVACVIGDGEAETGPLAASWHSNKFINPQRDGIVLPILHLNGYKIANPTVLSRISHDELDGADDRLRAPRRGSSRATSPRRCTRRWPPRSTRSSPSTARIKADPRPASARAGRCSCCAPRRAGPGPHQGTPRAAPSGPAHRPGHRRASSRPGCAPTGPRSSSTSTAARAPR